MKLKRRYSSVQSIGEDIPVIFKPISETNAEFQKRKVIVQEMIMKMILLGKKRGRPSKEEDTSEEAA